MIIRMLFPIFLMLSITVLLIQSLKLDIFTNSGVIGPGFLPLVLSILIIVILIIEVLVIIKKKESNPHQAHNKKGLRQVIFVISIILTLILIKFFGMLISLGLFIFITLLTLEKRSLMNSILFSLISLLVIYIIFDRFLGVSLTKGILN